MLPCIPRLDIEVKVDFAFLKFVYGLIMFPCRSTYLFSIFLVLQLALYIFFTFTSQKRRIPIIGGKELDLHRLFVEVTSRGGIEKVKLTCYESYDQYFHTSNLMKNLELELVFYTS